MTKADQSEPARRCIATGTSAPKSSLIRFVVGPDGGLVPDLAERLPGRGIWVAADLQAVETAVAKKLFSRAAKAAVDVPDDLIQHLCGMMSKRCQDIIGLARRSNLLVVGYERVLEALERGGTGVVAIASDAGGNRHSVAAAAEDARVPVVVTMTRAELSAPTGKGAVSFLTILNGGLALSLRKETERLTGLRPVKMDVNK